MRHPLAPKRLLVTLPAVGFVFFEDRVNGVPDISKGDLGATDH